MSGAVSVRAGFGEGNPGSRAAEPPTWQEVFREAIREPLELAKALQLDDAWLAGAMAAHGEFSVFVPRGFLARMKPGDPRDPLLLQVLPQSTELQSAPGFGADPVGDSAAQREAGLLHKYAGRVLLVTTGVCAIHCRYCFRRHFPYSEGPRSLDDWQPAIDAIAADPSISEVILSGGDPLTLGDSRLAELTRRLAAIPHLARLRVHSRVPIVVPERVTDSLIAWLRGSRLAPIMVVHANHPAEIDATVATALARLVDAGIPVLNQSVLLAGVNDDAETLAALCRKLVDLRVLPYYLHQLDRVAGAAHFEVPEEKGLAIMEALREQLPGYAVPKYVREAPGARSKLEV